MTTNEELARTAYSTYGEVTGHKNFQGDPMPDYADLGPTIQTAWAAAALVCYRQGYHEARIADEAEFGSALNPAYDGSSRAQVDPEQ